MKRDKDKEELYIEDSLEFEEELGDITFTDMEADVQENVNDDFVGEEDLYTRSGKKKKKKKRKKKRYLLKFIILLLVVIAVVVFLRSDFFNMDKINVKNNSHYTEEQVIELAGIKIGDNLFEFTARGMEKKLTKDPYIKTVEVQRILPDSLVITVTERKEQIVIPYENKFLVADLDGMLLKVADEAPDITLVNNLTVKDPKPGTALEVKETQILTDTLNLLKDVDKAGLYFKEISVSQHSVKAYIYDSLTLEGGYDKISENLQYLPQVLDDLLNKKKVKRGTIKASGNKYFSFQPEVETTDK